MLSYNTNWWHYHQESAGSDNWDIPSNKKEWYACITKKTVEADEMAALYYIEFGTSLEMLEEISTYYCSIGYQMHLRQKGRNGYLPKDCFAVLPYSGQWGKGWIIATHKDSVTVTILYALIENKGGTPDGIADYYE